MVLADADGGIYQANRAARKAFGEQLPRTGATLEQLWPADGAVTGRAFLADLGGDGSNSATLRFRCGEAVQAFTVTGLAGEGEESAQRLLQLFPESSRPAAPAPRSAADEPGAAQKQKLDCALQLTRNVALDFNNALTSILGHTSLLLSQVPAGNAWRGSLLEIEKSAEKAAEIAHDLAVFSRQEKDQRTQQAGNLNQLLRRSVELFKTPALSQMGWKLRLDSRLYTAKFDEAKLQQAFVKILENASQAVARDGHIMVITSNKDVAEPTQIGSVNLPPGSYVAVEIWDNGCGIPPELLPRIIEPFFTTKPGHRGLGLAWAYGIISNHAGHLSISSELGKGTSVVVYLPAQARVISEVLLQENELRGTQTILMVDDEDLLLTMGQMILSAYDYRVLTANSGHKALQILADNANKIDLVITDLVMPNMSGRELIEQIRVLAPDMRTICSSGYVRANANEEEEDAYLQKPFTSHDLLSKVKQALAVA
ncbi:hypothetical protein LBMAG56_48420 [Verrucomicrobiota bacterium]|nr:hypothetical protein LBMAG56_48420 [Verrucomicrobiota bacterium]